MTLNVRILARKITSLTNRSAVWPPNYHKTTKTFTIPSVPSHSLELTLNELVNMKAVPTLTWALSTNVSYAIFTPLMFCFTNLHCYIVDCIIQFDTTFRWTFVLTLLEKLLEQNYLLLSDRTLNTAEHVITLNSRFGLINSVLFNDKGLFTLSVYVEVRR